MRTAINAVLQGIGLGLLASIVVGGAVALAVGHGAISAGENQPDTPDQTVASQKARVLAQSISEGMNSAAAVGVVAIPLMVVFMVRRARRHRA